MSNYKMCRTCEKNRHLDEGNFRRVKGPGNQKWSHTCLACEGGNGAPAPPVLSEIKVNRALARTHGDTAIPLDLARLCSVLAEHGVSVLTVYVESREAHITKNQKVKL